MRVLLVHGWGYGPQMWGALMPLLPPHWRCDAMEDWDFSAVRVQDYDLCVGHSYGFFAGYQAMPHARWVAINSAPCFVRGPENPQGIPLRVLRQMTQRFQTHPAEVLKAFHQTAGAPYPCTTSKADLLPALQAMQVPRPCPAHPILCALTATGDPIVSYPWAPHAHTVHTHPSASHLLPLTHAPWCGAAVGRVEHPSLFPIP
ncbi:MAG: hypothetical protein ACKO43_00715 [Alphaproteobacteria bacterium]